MIGSVRGAERIGGNFGYLYKGRSAVGIGGFGSIVQVCAELLR